MKKLHFGEKIVILEIPFFLKPFGLALLVPLTLL